jgi:hypothetical protein
MEGIIGILCLDVLPLAGTLKLFSSRAQYVVLFLSSLVHVRCRSPSHDLVQRPPDVETTQVDVDRNKEVRR